jgi:Flp pilus assembly protein TadB
MGMALGSVSSTAQKRERERERERAISADALMSFYLITEVRYN